MELKYTKQPQQPLAKRAMLPDFILYYKVIVKKKYCGTETMTHRQMEHIRGPRNKPR
jgi:hypothetical protein